jgi:beta-glucosidase
MPKMMSAAPISPLSVPSFPNVFGFVELLCPGFGAGEVIEPLVFRSVVPSAKLAVTFARSEVDLPHVRIFGASSSAAKTGASTHWVADEEKRQTFVADYNEGVRFGYKWFDSENKQPLFPFGYGLSYTQFKYRGLQIDSAAQAVTFTVENTGTRDATEIAQVYVQLPKSSGEHFRRLAAWQRVRIDGGKQKTVTVALEPLALATFNEKTDAWSWLSGKYTVFVGGSSRDLPLQAQAALH